MHTDSNYRSVLRSVGVNSRAANTANAGHDEADGIVNVVNSCFNVRSASKKPKEGSETKEAGKRGRKRKELCEQPDRSQRQLLGEIDDNATDGFSGTSNFVQNSQQQLSNGYCKFRIP